MWLSRIFKYKGHVLNFINKNKELISNVSITNDGDRFIVFFYTDDSIVLE